MNIIRFWFNNSRTTALPQSMLPAILAVCMASTMEQFSLWLGILAVIGVLFGHLSMNLFDDYFDYKVKKSDYRDSMAREGMRARISKCEYLTSGKATVKQLLIACMTFGAVSLIIGFIIFLQRGEIILYYTLTSMLLGVSYSGKPLKLSYRGLGDVIIGIMFGPMLMSGVYYAACGTLNWEILLISIPIGLLVANIVYTHSIMDYEPDKKVGKITFAVLLNNKKAMLFTLFFLLVISYGCIIFGVCMNFLSWYYLFVLLTLPMAVSLFYLMVEFVKDPTKSFTPKFWMGPMGNWERIQKAEIDWFMIRWFSARNLLSFFCLIIIVVTFIK